MMLRTEVADTATPSLEHSPTIRMYPQRGFSRPTRRPARWPLGGTAPWPRRTLGPVAAHELAMPSDQGGRGDEKDRPPVPGYELGQTRQHGTVGVVEPRAGDLALEDADLVAKHSDLDVVVIRSWPDPNDAEHKTNEQKLHHRAHPPILTTGITARRARDWELAPHRFTLAVLDKRARVEVRGRCTCVLRTPARTNRWNEDRTHPSW